MFSREETNLRPELGETALNTTVSEFLKEIILTVILQRKMFIFSVL